MLFFVKVVTLKGKWSSYKGTISESTAPTLCRLGNVEQLSHDTNCVTVLDHNQNMVIKKHELRQELLRHELSLDSWIHHFSNFICWGIR